MPEQMSRAPGESWPKDFLIVEKERPEHAMARLSYLPGGRTGTVSEINGENETTMMKILRKEKELLRSWAGAKVKLSMVLAAQAHNVMYQGQLAANVRAIEKVWAQDGSPHMHSKLYAITYGPFLPSQGVNWEVSMETLYMKEKNITYSTGADEETGREKKGCISRIITQKLNEIRSDIRKAGKKTHGVMIKVRDDPRSPLDGSTKPSRKRKSNGFSVFDPAKHVRQTVSEGGSSGTVVGGAVKEGTMVTISEVSQAWGCFSQYSYPTCSSTIHNFALLFQVMYNYMHEKTWPQASKPPSRVGGSEGGERSDISGITTLAERVAPLMTDKVQHQQQNIDDQQEVCPASLECFSIFISF
jgi:hypothetical protein